jgi:hypothetical protein
MTERIERIDPADICDFAMAYGAYAAAAADDLTNIRILLEARYQAGMLDAFPDLVELRYQLRDISDRLTFFGRYVKEAAAAEEQRREAEARTPLQAVSMPSEGGEAS